MMNFNLETAEASNFHPRLNRVPYTYPELGLDTPLYLAAKRR